MHGPPEGLFVEPEDAGGAGDVGRRWADRVAQGIDTHAERLGRDAQNHLTVIAARRRRALGRPVPGRIPSDVRSSAPVKQLIYRGTRA